MNNIETKVAKLSPICMLTANLFLFSRSILNALENILDKTHHNVSLNLLPAQTACHPSCGDVGSRPPCLTAGCFIACSSIDFK